MRTTQTHRVWTIAETKARLSEILRLAESEGPQRIGTRKSFIVVPAHVWDEKLSPRKPLGQWLIENMPRRDRSRASGPQFNPNNPVHGR